MKEVLFIIWMLSRASIALPPCHTSRAKVEAITPVYSDIAAGCFAVSLCILPVVTALFSGCLERFISFFFF
ncbi:hypothetical protein [Marinospirillum alkaliphilum]|uniref:hypothetical protein n=1 Tax=Marinospirillum alkaliphilum TaxID=148454 RepID=UPI0011601FD7|nr:hypothetical protein [Marinospirillum alkaliphilum]